MMNTQTMSSSTEAPLYVDLDGTLIKTDLLLEQLFALLKQAPLTLFLLPFWLMRGRGYLKSALAQRAALDPAGLPYDERLLALMVEERARGRRVVLATASHRLYAEAVARHVGLFDGVLASDETINLKSHRKLGAIKADAGEAGFDYAGNEAADLPIWREARKALVVNAAPGIVRRAQRYGNAELFARTQSKSYPALLFKAIRAHQWLKNILVFLPALAAHKASDIHVMGAAVAAFFAFSLCASSVYLLNDLSDLPADRAHPRKRDRPFASGALSLYHGLALFPVLVGTSIVISLSFLPPAFLMVLALYFASSMAYNFLAKDRVIWDVIILAGLYALRVLGGVAATSIPPSFWLLAFSMFMFLSLALVKRYAEMEAVARRGQSQARGRGYLTSDMPLLESMGLASGYLAVLVVALYINSPEIHAGYRHPVSLWPVCPLILFWISRIWLKTHRGEMHDDPVVYAARDRFSLFIAAMSAIAIALAGPLHYVP
jgi:4-hydroxybenzoate polyprenyltransferase/phosphoserine phosphatase